MRYPKTLLLAVPLVALALTEAHDASACGGCFVMQSETSQVTGHKMILSVSQAETTLWDQISYSGNPANFAWILPTKGIVKVGLSSDALFQNLDQTTQVTILAPTIQCSPPPGCSGSGSPSEVPYDSGGGVEVLAQEVVGPYETTQLEATDPMALKTWLATNGYAIPADVLPVIDAYVGEKFNFLALKLAPGKDVASMRPVRVTTPGASPVLPLRMVAAGTGATTSISLWVLGEGRYEPANMSSFVIDSSQLIWDWNSKSSNYSLLKKAGFDASLGKAWLVEDAEPMANYEISDWLLSLAEYEPQSSGYGGVPGKTPVEEAYEDLQALFGQIPDTTLWVTRLHGELSRAALVADLEVGASANQTPVDNILQATKTTGTPPACPSYPPCDDPGTQGGGGTGAGDPHGSGPPVDGSGCAMSQGPGAPAVLSALALTAALAFSRRRRRA
jgi:hypothetical protein